MWLKKKAEKVEEIEETEVEEENIVEDEVEDKKEETLDDYVYGEVIENFDELQAEPTDAEGQEQATEEVSEETSNEVEEAKPEDGDKPNE